MMTSLRSLFFSAIIFLPAAVSKSTRPIGMRDSYRKRFRPENSPSVYQLGPSNIELDRQYRELRRLAEERRMIEDVEDLVRSASGSSHTSALRKRSDINECPMNAGLTSKFGAYALRGNDGNGSPFGGPRERGYVMIPTDLDMSGEGCTEPATETSAFVGKRALCPWKWRFNFDPNRIPRGMLEAECLCDKSTDASHDYECEPVTVLMRVLQKEGATCDTYAEVNQTLIVGCTAVRRASSGHSWTAPAVNTEADPTMIETKRAGQLEQPIRN